MNDYEARDESGHLIRSLHGVTLSTILEALVATYGWSEMASRIRINCFAVNPSLKSSLTFLRRTPWAREKVEALYIEMRTAESLMKHTLEDSPQPQAARRLSSASSHTFASSTVAKKFSRPTLPL